MKITKRMPKSSRLAQLSTINDITHFDVVRYCFYHLRQLLLVWKFLFLQRKLLEIWTVRSYKSADLDYRFEIIYYVLFIFVNYNKVIIIMFIYLSRIRKK